MDFWNLWHELTAAEFATLLAAYELDPWGVERDDLRAAWQTMQVVASQAAKTPSEDDFRKLLKSLTSFTELQRHEHDEADKTPATFGTIGAMLGAT